MNNITYIDIDNQLTHKYYDLKGSKVNRYSPPNKSPLKD